MVVTGGFTISISREVFEDAHVCVEVESHSTSGPLPASPLTTALRHVHIVERLTRPLSHSPVQTRVDHVDIILVVKISLKKKIWILKSASFCYPLSIDPSSMKTRVENVDSSQGVSSHQGCCFIDRESEVVSKECCDSIIPQGGSRETNISDRVWSSVTVLSAPLKCCLEIRNQLTVSVEQIIIGRSLCTIWSISEHTRFSDCLMHILLTVDNLHCFC